MSGPTPGTSTSTLASTPTPSADGSRPRRSRRPPSWRPQRAGVRGWWRRAVGVYGWRMYAIPVLSVITVLVLIDVVRDGGGRAQAQSANAGDGGQVSEQPANADPSTDTARLPSGGTFTQ
ncbi:MAG: hypothetical protein J2O49_10025, partial [Sciscionella sp.]|nr:hypothetical protein [Sciscionella sp.]